MADRAADCARCAPTHRRKAATPAIGAAVIVALLGLAADRLAAPYDERPPAVRSIVVARAFFDLAPTPILVSAGWERVSVTVPAWRLESDWTLWRSMRFEDWDTVPAPLRDAGLSAMVRRYQPLLGGAWSTLDTAAWDNVPLPIRAMVVLRMIDAQVAAAVGGPFNRGLRRISDTVAAIVMAESWFEHRAVNVNTSGERDLGLSQASAGCRRRLALLHARGEIPDRFEEADYFHPWKATRVAVFWYLRLLDAAGGDESIAVRAYNKGLRSAAAGKGMEYLARMEALRLRFIRNQDAPPSWDFVYSRARFGTPTTRDPALLSR